MAAPADILASLKGRFPGVSILEPSPVKGYPVIRISSADQLIPCMRYLKEDCGFEYMDFVTAVDWKGVVDLRGYIQDPNPNPFLPEGATPQVLPKPVAGFPYREKIEVVYALSNWKERLRIFIRFEADRSHCAVPSVVSLYPTADWQEREVFDLMGIIFEGHPNLKKILTPDFIQGHPLRKDYVHIKDKYD